MNMEQIPLPNLSHIIHNVLIVQQRRPFLLLLRPHRYIRHRHPLQALMHTPRILPARRNTPSTTQRRQFALVLRVRGRMAVSMHLLVHGITQLHITQHQQTHVAGVVRTAVVGGLGRHVGKVHALAEHVPVDRGFGGCDAETLAEDTTEVGTAGAVPEETAVGVLEAAVGVSEAVGFAGAFDAKDVDYAVAEVVCCASGVVEVLLEFDVLGGVRFN